MALLTVHTRSRHTYGSPRIRIELQASRIGIGRRRIARIMRQQRIVGRCRKRRSPRTTHSNHDHPIAPNLLQDRVPAQAIDEIWRTDITCVPTDEGWLSVAAMMDAYSRRIVGWSCASTLATGLCLEALRKALLNRRPPAGLTQSMSRKANCYDNAMIESFWSTLKTESTARNHFKTRAQARLAVFDYIECIYNPHRRHSSIGGVSPVAFETLNN